MLNIQICLIGLAMLFIPLLNRQRSYGNEQVYFRTVVILVMLDLLSETCAWVLDGSTFAGAHTLIYIVNYLTIQLQPVMGLLWLYYTMEKLGLVPEKSSKIHFLCALPLIVNTVLLLTNHWTGHIFTVSDANEYARGHLFFIDVIVSFGYPLTATIISLIAASRAENRMRKRECHVLASFILPPVIAAVIQVIWYGTFLFLIGFALSLLIVFINLQNDQITLDFLTRINNRASFIAYYEKKIRNLRRGSSMYLFMIDINSFKTINDTYGHNVGDQVLITVADRLKYVCSGTKSFLARLGGDEFGILMECEQLSEAAEFAVKIQSALDDFNSDSNLSSPVTLSIGYAAGDSENCSIDRLIQQADAMMYSNKAKHYMLGDNNRRNSDRTRR